jgi:hypothetical protein
MYIAIIAKKSHTKVNIAIKKTYTPSPPHPTKEKMPANVIWRENMKREKRKRGNIQY